MQMSQQQQTMSLLEDAILISLNSSDAVQQNGTMLSNLLFTTNGILNQDDIIDHADIQLVSAQIPASYYVVNPNNNTLNYTVSAVNFSLTLIPGNYNYNSLSTMMIALFLVNGHTVTTTLNNTTNIVSFQFTGTLQFKASSTCGAILGFASTITSAANVLTMTYPLNLIGPLKLKIMSNLLPTGNIDSSAPCLAVVPVNVAPFQIIMFDNTNGHKNLLRAHFINAIDIRVTDQFGVLLDFNNTPWTITLRLGIWRWVMPKVGFHAALDAHNANAVDSTN